MARAWQENHDYAKRSTQPEAKHKPRVARLSGDGKHRFNSVRVVAMVNIRLDVAGDATA